MSDNYVDPILAEDFDPNGPEPTVDYSKMIKIDNTGKIIKEPNENGEVVLTAEERKEVIKEAKEILDVKDVIASIVLVEDLRIQKN